MKSILAIGEMLWDRFPDGPRFGGAPANFACACAELASPVVKVQMISAVGRDALGDEAREHLLRHGVDVSLLGRSELPTGEVEVRLDPHGVPSYRILDPAAWDDYDATPETLAAAASADVLLFGTLGQRAEKSRHAIRQLLAVAPNDAVIILDINLRPPFTSPTIVRDSLRLANVLKLNGDELLVISEMLGIIGMEMEQLEALRKRYSYRLIALTRGANGSVLMAADGTISDQPGAIVPVVDTVGAGDAFTAAVAVGLIQGRELGEIHRRAEDIARFVCTQPGATPWLPARFREIERLSDRAQDFD